MQNGAITPEQYREIQDNILSDIKKVQCDGQNYYSVIIQNQ